MISRFCVVSDIVFLIARSHGRRGSRLRAHSVATQIVSREECAALRPGNGVRSRKTSAVVHHARNVAHSQCVPTRPNRVSIDFLPSFLTVESAKSLWYILEINPERAGP